MKYSTATRKHWIKHIRCDMHSGKFGVRQYGLDSQLPNHLFTLMSENKSLKPGCLAVYPASTPYQLGDLGQAPDPSVPLFAHLELWDLFFL